MTLKAPIISLVLAISSLAARSQEIPLPIIPPTTNDSLSVTLAWDHSPSDNVTNYVLLVGTNSGEYVVRQDTGYTNRFTLTDVFDQVTNYFVALAENDMGIQSLPSDELAVFLPLQRPAPPVLHKDITIGLKVWAKMDMGSEWILLKELEPMLVLNRHDYQFIRVEAVPDTILRLH